MLQYQQPRRISFFRILEIIITINVLLLNFFIVRNFLGGNTQIKLTQTEQPLNVSPTPSPIQTPTPELTTGTPSPTTLATIPSSSSDTNTQTTTVKELFIPLGQGQNNSGTWTDVPGVQTYLDSTNYSGVKQMLFEASITVPTANETVWIRLYDKTDNHPVWYSDMSMTGSSQFLSSAPISLDSGHKLYQVQMQTQLQYPATLQQARLHIILQ